ncbi:uncharacterized protein LOC135076524 [Ostrinia nubilalis]|uniref:uncharacterized protein LOC135076524 n=1 Tax=Ostrinia nubilalis TaxID=29057 RepID=UPI0030824D2D
MFYLILVALCPFVTTLNASEIKIQIDTNDLLKLLSGFMSSELIRKFANQMVQRTAIKYGSYNNPYHPEDNIVNNMEAENAANALIDANLEKDNDNFLSGDEEKNEDQFSETEKSKNGNVGMNTKEKTTKTENITKERSKYPLLPDRFENKEAKENKKNLKYNQRRYVLKGSK